MPALLISTSRLRMRLAQSRPASRTHLAKVRKVGECSAIRSLPVSVRISASARSPRFLASPVDEHGRAAPRRAQRRRCATKPIGRAGHEDGDIVIDLLRPERSEGIPTPGRYLGSRARRRSPRRLPRRSPPAGRWWRWRARSSPTGCRARATSRSRAQAEAAVRDDGALPATIAVVGGEARVGLDATRSRRWRSATTW